MPVGEAAGGEHRVLAQGEASADVHDVEFEGPVALRTPVPLWLRVAFVAWGSICEIGSRVSIASAAKRAAPPRSEYGPTAEN